MTRSARRHLLLGAGLAVSILALSACSAPTPDDGVLRVVASTNVYGSIAQAVGGDGVEVTSIMSRLSQDPHSFEANARTQLAIATADVVIQNGGGYDNFVGTLLAGVGNPGIVVITAVELYAGGTEAPDPELNEHVWYDLPTMAALATRVAKVLGEIDPAARAQFRANASAFADGLSGLQDKITALKVRAAGTGVAITEPVPLYLLEAAGLRNQTPSNLSEAIEEGTDVSPALLKQLRDLIEDGKVGAFVYNAQTIDSTTEELLVVAKKAGVPIVPVTENLPPGTDYLSWMDATITKLERALR